MVLIPSSLASWLVAQPLHGAIFSHYLVSVSSRLLRISNRSCWQWSPLMLVEAASCSAACQKSYSILYHGFGQIPSPLGYSQELRTAFLIVAIDILNFSWLTANEYRWILLFGSLWIFGNQRWPSPNPLFLLFSPMFFHDVLCFPMFFLFQWPGNGISHWIAGASPTRKWARSRTFTLQQCSRQAADDWTNYTHTLIGCW